MYTIEQLSRVIERWDAMLESGIHDEVVEQGIRRLGKVTLARQLLDTMRQLEAVQARIDAAAAIEQRAYDYSVGNRGGDEEIMYGEANGWNECWYTFRRALGKDSECHE